MNVSSEAQARALSFRCPALEDVVGFSALIPVRLSGSEGVNSLFEYELVLKTPDETSAFGAEVDGAADFDLDRFIGHEMRCAIELDAGDGTREINALVVGAALWGEEGRHVQYKLTLRPWLHLAALTTDCKIFQNRTVVEILRELLADYDYFVDMRLTETAGATGNGYPRRDYQTQFNESDFQFFSRLTQEWGISYHFEHIRGQHRLVLTDAVGTFLAHDSDVYNRVDFHPPGWRTADEYIHAFAPSHLLTSGRYATRDYDYTRSLANLNIGIDDPRPTGEAMQEVYQWQDGLAGSHYAQPGAGVAKDGDPWAEGRQLARLRMDALRTHGRRAEACGNLRGMVPGRTFWLNGHPRESANVEYLVLDSTLLLEVAASDSQRRLNGTGDTDRRQQWRAEVKFVAHPLSEQLRPMLTQPKPLTRGPQPAVVVGPEGQSICTDNYGRIKVQFPWDRLGQKNQNSSCWLRVSSPWAGNQLGGVNVPRIGQEVIVDFYGGDPDLPICTGRVHNQMNLPPWSLPGQSALSGLRSRELRSDAGNSAAGRSNHLVLDDTADAIQAQLRSDLKHSQLALGRITRIEDNAGRKDARGEGFELRTDGHGVVRAARGLLLTTEARIASAAHATDMGETLQRLNQARERHGALADLAQQHQAQESDADQTAVSAKLKAQDDDIRGTGGSGASRAEGQFPELAAPHLVLASSAGIAATAAQTLHLAAGADLATDSAGHTSIAAGKSFLVSAAEALRMFAHRAGIRLFAARGPIQVQAHDDRIELVAQKVIELISTTDWIRLKGKEGISLEAGGSTFKLTAGGFQFHTAGAHHVWAADHQTFGPKTLQTALPELPKSVCLTCLLKAAKAGGAITRF